ncbi:peptide ABC transporter permease [Mesorhizobium sp. M0340]|uniref:peptide ABC transporter permease n=1 Tax=Mesorhizobium sp. M0340 TaxID=2956939 RepID=UPI00333569BF
MSSDPDQNDPVFSAEQARQGEIILRTRARRITFIAGPVGLVFLVWLVWWI